MKDGFNRSTIVKIKKIAKTPTYIMQIPRIISKPSYYPEMERKTNLEMWWDNIKWIIKYHEPMRFYMSYGLDIKAFHNPDDYIPTSVFWDYIREGNRKEIKTYGKYNYLVLLRDKYVFSAMISSTIGAQYIPKTIALIDRGSAFLPAANEWKKFSDFCKTDLRAVFKVVDGTFGEDVSLIEIYDNKVKKDDQILDPEEFAIQLGDRRYIVQELVVQHSALQAFGTRCVNTIRIITLRGKSGAISVFSAFLRVSTNTTSFVDNRAKGSLAVGVDLENGKLMKYGFPHARFGEKVDVHPLSGIVFEGYQLPFWNETKELVCAAHRQFGSLQSIGWDVAIRENGPILIEGNDSWEISGPQDTMGGLKKRWYNLIEQ